MILFAFNLFFDIFVESGLSEGRITANKSWKEKGLCGVKIYN